MPPDRHAGNSFSGFPKKELGYDKPSQPKLFSSANPACSLRFPIAATQAKLLQISTTQTIITTCQIFQPLTKQWVNERLLQIRLRKFRRIRRQHRDLVIAGINR
jgi:hypothetical protein